MWEKNSVREKKLEFLLEKQELKFRGIADWRDFFLVPEESL